MDQVLWLPPLEMAGLEAIHSVPVVGLDSLPLPFRFLDGPDQFMSP